MRIIKEFLKWFFYITTGILIVCAINFEIARADVLPKATLWQILLSGFLTTVVTAFLSPKEEKRKNIFFLQMLIHYLTLCIVMIVCGHWFGWLRFRFSDVMMIAVSVAAVYGIVFFAWYLTDKKYADEINRRLREQYGEDRK